MFVVAYDPIKIVLGDSAFEIWRAPPPKSCVCFLIEMLPDAGWQKYLIGSFEFTDHVREGVNLSHLKASNSMSNSPPKCSSLSWRKVQDLCTG